MNRTRTPTEAYGAAEALARRAVALDPTDAEARSSLSEAMLWSRGDYQGALIEAERARVMSPNLAFAHAILGAALIFPDSGRTGLRLFTYRYGSTRRIPCCQVG